MKSEDLEDARKDVVVGENTLSRHWPVLLERNLDLDEHLTDALNLLRRDDRVGAVCDVAVDLDPVLNVACVPQTPQDTTKDRLCWCGVKGHLCLHFCYDRVRHTTCETKPLREALVKVVLASIKGRRFDVSQW